jgi:uncharacterized phiE125 gp8 family phage protein
MSLTRVTAPAVSPVSLQQAKDHLRISHSDDDAKVQFCIDAATAYVDAEDGFLGRCLVTQTWLLTLDAFPLDEIKIPLPPLQGVVSVSYDDPNGNGQTILQGDYYVDVAKEPGWVVPLDTWPTTLEAINAVRIIFNAGYPATSDSPPDLRANIPASIRQAMLLMIGSYFENRLDELVANVEKFPFPFASQNLLRPLRVQLGMA